MIGFNSSKFTTNVPEIAEEANSNFLFGAFVRIGKKAYIQPEIAWVTKGGILNNDSIQGANTTIKLSQVEVPVMLGFKLINLEVVNVRLMLGPSVGFITNKEVQPSDLVTDPIPESSLQNIQWGFQLGAGVDVLFLTLDVRYEFGLNNLYIAPDGGTSYDMKNNVWRVTLGWAIL